MAVTIQQEPSEVTPAFNQCAYVLSSDKVATNSDHYYIAVIKNEAGDQISRQEFVGAPGFANGYIDIHRIVSNLVTFDFELGLIAVTKMDNSAAYVEVEFSEYYGGVERPSIVNSIIYVTNMGLNTYEYLSYNSANYVVDFLNTTSKIKIDSLAWLAFRHDSLTTIDTIVVTANNIIGDKISTITNPWTAFATWQEGFLYFPSGSNLNNIDSSYVTPPAYAGDIVPSDTVYLTIELYDGAVLQATHEYDIISSKFNPNYSKSCYSDYELYYLNKNGAFETLVMGKGYKVNQQMTRQNASRIMSKMTSTTTYGYALDSAMRVNNQITYQGKWKLNSDWISEQESANYLEMVNSPVIYLNDGTKTIRVVCSESSYQEKSERYDRLFNFSVTVEESQKQERQWVN
jgi:hypothetical protein